MAAQTGGLATILATRTAPASSFDPFQNEGSAR
jgi:hypothetical protein